MFTNIKINKMDFTILYDIHSLGYRMMKGTLNNKQKVVVLQVLELDLFAIKILISNTWIIIEAR